jgi:hypothetical protein
MAVKPTNVTIRKDLTNYAFGVTQDAVKARRLLQKLAPVVPTGGTSGLYNKFDETQAFKEYAKAVTRRAVGGQANIVQFLSDTANYNCDPNGLRISIDNHERMQAGDAQGASLLLEQAKTRVLTINCLVGTISEAITVAKAGISAMAGKGDWANPNVDPVKELNDAIKAVYLASGMVPTDIIIDFGAWCVMSGNKNVLNRMPGADIAEVSPGRVSRLLVAPGIEITIAETAGLTGGGLGNSSATKQGLMGGSVFVCYSSEVPTVYDPSFMKTFSPSANLFTEVYSYREEPHLDWFENDWTSEIVLVSSNLCKRIDVSGATS